MYHKFFPSSSDITSVLKKEVVRSSETMKTSRIRHIVCGFVANEWEDDDVMGLKNRLLRCVLRIWSSIPSSFIKGREFIESLGGS